jgi:hypothetical protein
MEETMSKERKTHLAYMAAIILTITGLASAALHVGFAVPAAGTISAWLGMAVAGVCIIMISEEMAVN